eukprot:XP_011671700.1 PREDICTED: uncharacterized protein LOC105441855 [Strongylocentrotus purpuratus]
MTRKKNKVTPSGYHSNSNQSASPQPQSDEKQAKLGKVSWNKVTNFFSQLACTERGGVKVVHSEVKVKVVSMYGELSDSDHQKLPQTKPKYPHHRSEFEEVVFALPEELTTNPNDAKVTIPTSALPKPNECNNTKEQLTNAEILQELSSNGLVSDASKPSVVLENIKPGGVSFEVRMTTVRPRTAKGQRVPKPPRRLESLERETDSEKRQRMEEISAKIKSKQEKATLKRQNLQETRQQMRQEKSHKIKEAVHECIAAALDIDTTTIVEKTEAEKEERAEAIRQEQQDERLQRQDITNGRTVLARKSKEFSQFGLPSEVRFGCYSCNTGNFILEIYL